MNIKSFVSYQIITPHFVKVPLFSQKSFIFKYLNKRKLPWSYTSINHSYISINTTVVLMITNILYTHLCLILKIHKVRLIFIIFKNQLFFKAKLCKITHISSITLSLNRFRHLGTHRDVFGPLKTRRINILEPNTISTVVPPSRTVVQTKCEWYARSVPPHACSCRLDNTSFSKVAFSRKGVRFRNRLRP